MTAAASLPYELVFLTTSNTVVVKGNGNVTLWNVSST